MRVDAILIRETIATEPPAPAAVELNHAGRHILRRLLKRAAVNKP
jgi:hypothetical protein